MADGRVFMQMPPIPLSACAGGCQHARTGRYRGGHEDDVEYSAQVLIEERTCGAWVMMIADIDYKLGRR